MLKPRADFMTDKELSEAPPELLLEILLELRADYRVVCKTRNDLSMNNALLVKKLAAIRSAVDGVA